RRSHPRTRRPHHPRQSRRRLRLQIRMHAIVRPPRRQTSRHPRKNRNAHRRPHPRLRMERRRLGRNARTLRTNRKSKIKNRKSSAHMLEVQAAREHTPGTAFPADTIWQKEFENAFPYPPTEDQARAAEEIKADLARPRPSDRLLCGDVGYGKTEVAMRAAFKV